MESSPDAITLPRIVCHGTTGQYIDRYTEEDGTYRPPLGEGIWANATADVRAWPKHRQPHWTQATVIIDMWRAQFAKAITGAFYFQSLPSGSYRVLRDSECSFAPESVQYETRLDDLTRELIRQPLLSP